MYVCTQIIGSAYIGLALLRDWAAHDYFLSAKSERWAENMIRVGLGASLIGGLATSDPGMTLYSFIRVSYQHI
jgi:hypothetical protein